MARRRNSVLDFIEGFNSAYGAVRKVKQDDELMEIANAKQQGLAPVDDIVATPSADGQGPAVGATQQVLPRQIEFLGVKSDKPLTDEQVSNARTMAMAGVLKKYGDPVAGLRLEQQAREGAQRSRLTDLQIGQAERQEKRDKKADEDQAALDRVDQDVAAWSAQRMTNPDGTARDMTMDDQLATGQYRVSKLISAGKLKEANALAKENMAFASNKIQLDTQQRNEALARVSAQVAAGDLSGLAQFYDRFVPDGARVKGIAVDPTSGKVTIERETIDGRPARTVEFKNANEVMAALNVFKDPMSLYNFSQTEFARSLQEKGEVRAERADKRADNADRRAERALQIQAGTAAVSNAHTRALTTEVTERTNDRRALNTLHTDLSTAIEKGDKDAEEKTRAKLLTYTIGNKGVQMSEIERKANFFLASGAAKTPAEAATMAHQKVQTSPKDDYIKMTTSTMPLTGDQLDSAMETLHGPNWKAKVRGDGDVKVQEFATPAEVDAAAKAGKIKKGDRVIVNGRSATWQ